MRSEEPVTQVSEAPSAVSGRSAYMWAGSVTILLVVVDRITKVWAWSELSDGAKVLIDPWLSLQLAENRGAAFGLMQDGGSLLAVAAVVAVVVIGVALRSVVHRGEAIALGMVLAGAVGNLIDRVLRGPGLVDGAVVDWIKFPNFPNFNVADSSITVGVVLLLAMSLFRRE